MKSISKLLPSDKKVLVAGHFCLDLLPDLSNVPKGKFYDLFIPGHLIEAGNMTIATGGSASNTGLSLSKLGIATTIIARLGEDAFGHMASAHIEQFISHDNNRLNLVRGENTSYTVIVNPPEIDRIFLHHPGANNTFTEQDVDFQLNPESVLFHFGYPQLMKSMFKNDGERLVRLFKNAKQAGLTTSLDTTLPDPSSEMGNVKWRHVLERTLPYVDIFSPSFEEAFFMLDPMAYSANPIPSDPIEMGKIAIDLSNEILACGSKIAMIKMGEYGTIVRIATNITKETFGNAWFSQITQWCNRLLWAPSFKVSVAGTTGAGDATIAGFLASIANELSAEESLLFAMAVGACNVEALDSISGIHSWQETALRVNGGWQQTQLPLNQMRGWAYNSQTRVWEYLGADV